MGQAKRESTPFGRLSRSAICALALGASAVGCSSTQYHYVPAQHQAQGKKRTEAIYANPAGPNSGFVRVTSVGMVKLRPKQDSHELDALQIRVALSNQSNRTWSFDASKQAVFFPNQGRISPVYVNSTSDGLPHLDVAPGELRTLDLFFPLPASIEGAKQLQEFDFRWTFNVGKTEVAQVTPFDRQPIPPAPTVVYPYAPGPYLGFGWGPYWWYGRHPYWW